MLASLGVGPSRAAGLCVALVGPPTDPPPADPPDPAAAAPADPGPSETDPEDPPIQRPAQAPPDATTPPTQPPAPATPEPPASGPLLAPSSDEVELTRPPPTTGPDDGIGRDEKLRRYYAALYRPAHNPGRFNLGAAALFAAAGAREQRLGGRMGGLAVDAGQSFNSVGWALTASAFVGQTHFGAGQVYEFDAMVGIGPTLGLGRLSLIRNGFLDARIGYDFFYAPTRISSIGHTQGVSSRPDALAPHGPRLRINTGLLLHRPGSARFRHGLGVSFGYQALVGGLTGSFPFSNVLFVGVSYYLG
jgi:hypothetical protein